jgi:hypothetical protein
MGGGREIELFFAKKPSSCNLRFFISGPNTVVLYEIGTGQYAGEIPNLFDIEHIAFSQEGKFISIGSKQGVVSIWSTGPDLRENIFEVLD